MHDIIPLGFHYNDFYFNVSLSKINEEIKSPDFLIICTTELRNI